MHMCCIHFSNKKTKEVVGGIGVVWCGVVWGRHVSFVFTHPQTCQTGTLFFHPLQHSAANCAPVSCGLPAHSQRFPKRAYYLYRAEERQQRNNHRIEIEYRRSANMLEICHLYHNRNGVGSCGGKKKCSLQPVMPGESDRFHLQGARLNWHEIFLHISKSIIVLWSGLYDILLLFRFASLLVFTPCW